MASESFGEFFRLGSASSNIDQALVPEKYSPRGSAILAIQPLWEENDALYEVYGSACALTHYLRAIELNFETLLLERQADQLLRELVQILENCQPEAWTPSLLMTAGNAGTAG